MSPPSTASVIRACLIGLPVGLILIGSCTLFITEGTGRRSTKEATGVGMLRPVSQAGGMEGAIRHHVETLAVRIGPRSHERFDRLEAARFYLMSTLGPSNLGYAVREQAYPIGDRIFANLEVELPGKRWPDDVIVVGAHYDTITHTPGADDNASGVAAVLALAEAFAGSPQGRTIRFVAFTNEEPPWFQTPDMGSYRYAAELKRKNVRVVAMLSLESIGYFSDRPGSQKYPPPLDKQYPSVGNFIAVVGTPAHGAMVGFVHEAMLRAGTIPVEKGALPPQTPGVGWSDHWSFWEMGYPAVMLTGTAPFRNPNYHRPGDSARTLDYSRLTATVQATRRAIEALANTPDLPW